jgi:hypothetical protein
MRTIKWVAHPDETYRLICDTLFGPDAPSFGIGGAVTARPAGPPGEPVAETGELPTVVVPGGAGPVARSGGQADRVPRGTPGLMDPRDAVRPPSFPPSSDPQPPAPRW